MFARNLSRRRFLGAMGTSSALFIPLLRTLRAEAQSQIPPRLIFFINYYGSVPGKWNPSGDGTNFQLGPIHQPLSAHKNDLLILQGLNVKTQEGSHKGGSGGLLTGHNTMSSSQGSWSKGPSIDYLIAKHLNTQHLNLCTSDSNRTWSGTFTYSAASQPSFGTDNPQKAFDLIFANIGGGGGGGPDPNPNPSPPPTPNPGMTEMERIRAEKRSVLDLVRRDLASLKKYLSQNESAKITDHMDSIRDLEQSLYSPAVTGLIQHRAGNLNPLAGPGTCQPPPRPGTGFSLTDYETYFDIQSNLIGVAVACGLRQIATLAFSGTGGIRFTKLGANGGWHEISHYTQGGSEEQHAKIETWMAGRFSNLLDKLKAAPGGSVLNQTLAIWTNQLARGTHQLDNVPFVLAGQAGGRVRTGRVNRYSGMNHTALLAAICKMYGMNVASVGDPEHARPALTDLG